MLALWGCLQWKYDCSPTAYAGLRARSDAGILYPPEAFYQRGWMVFAPDRKVWKRAIRLDGGRSPSLAMSKVAEFDQVERRLHPRYPIALVAEYRLVSRDGTQCQGSCRTVNISTGGVLLEAQPVLSPLGPIEVSIEWPCLLRGVVPLKLIGRGDIVRLDGSSIAVKIFGYEFHTAGHRQLKKRSQQ
jgi:hypothetical protein